MKKTRFICMLALLGASVTSQAVTLNNPGFESDMSGWIEVDPASISGVENSGSKSLKITGSPARVHQVVSLETNTDYTLSAYVLGKGQIGANTGSIWPNTRFDTNEWTKVSVSFNTGNSNSVQIFAKHVGESVDARFDDFTLVEDGNNSPTPTPTPTPGTCSELNNLTIIGAQDDGSYDASYSPSRAFDGGLDTESRWSSDGLNKAITFELAGTGTVRSMSTAWFKANVRTAYFDVQTSTNNSSWTTVLSNGTASGTEALVTIDLQDSSARYVRIVGQGNSAGTWNSLIEARFLGCGDTSEPPQPTPTPTPTSSPNPDNDSIELIQSLFDLEGGDNDLNPYQSDDSLVFDALAARHVTSSGNGWRHELKMAEENRLAMYDTDESISADITAELSDGAKTIVAQYHASGTGTIVKIYVSDTNESNHDDSTALNGIFDVYARLKPPGSSSEVIVNFGTIRSGDTFDLSIINDRGNVTVSSMGVTENMRVDDSDESYLKFGNYLQAQDPETNDDIEDSDDWADFYSDTGITETVITFRNVEYSRN